MFFKRVIISLFCSLAFIFVFAFVIRIFNHKQGLKKIEITDNYGNITYTYYEEKGFLGLNDLVSFVENVDFSTPLDNFKSDIDNLIIDFRAVFDSTDTSTWIIDVIKFIADMLILPFKLTYDVLYLIYSYFKIFFDFIHWILTFDGYQPYITTT